MQQKILGIDWKAHLGLILAAAGVFVSWWIYQSDFSAKSISVQLVSQVSLQPSISRAMPDIEFSVDGKKLDQPYLTVINISNDGKRPITSADFEVPLELRFSSDSKLVRIQIADKSPEQLEPKFTETSTGFLLQPTLLNPGDSIKVVLINSGGLPKFRLFGRVVGIPTISLAEANQKAPNKIRLVILFAGASIAILIGIVLSDGILPGQGVFVRKRAAATLAVATLIPGAELWRVAMKEVGFTELLESSGLLLALMPVLMVLGGLLNRKLPKNKNDSM